MIRVYIAGPYSASNVIDVLDNMRRGMELAHRVLSLGFAPFCPWFDYHFSLIGPTSLEQYYQYSVAWLEVSDAVLLVPGWQNSRGTQTELKRASELGIPVFEHLSELENWAVRREIANHEAQEPDEYRPVQTQRRRCCLSRPM